MRITYTNNKLFNLKSKIMKQISRFFMLAVFALIVSANASIAQDGTTKENLRNQFKENLTDEQVQMLEENKEVTKALRDAFKETLTDEQKAIMENEELSMKERRTALKASYTDEQLAMLATNREAFQAQREAFQATLTDEQKARVEARKEAGNNFKKNKAKRKARGNQANG